MASPTSGEASGDKNDHPLSKEEEDNPDRSKKKVRTGDDSFTGTKSIAPREEEWMQDAVPEHQEEGANSSSPVVTTNEMASPMEESPRQDRKEIADTPMRECQVGTGVTDPKVKKPLIWESDPSNIPSFKDKLLGINGRGQGQSRFEVLSELEDTTSFEVKEKTQGLASMESDHMEIIVAPPPKSGNQGKGDLQGPKGRSKKTDTPSLGGKTLASLPKVGNAGKKGSKTHQEKANTHTVVTSNSSSIKHSARLGTTSSPSKPGVTSTKSPIKASTDSGKPKQRKPPDFDVTLEQMRIMEKSLRESEDLIILVQDFFKNLFSREAVPTIPHNRSRDWPLKKGFSNSDLCQRCKEAPETAIHAVRDCKYAKQLWTNLVRQDQHNKFFGSNLQTWLHENLSINMGGGNGLPWSLVFAVTCWICWKQRNDFIFNNKEIDASSSLRVTFSHVPRDGNYVADSLAKYGHSLPLGLRIFTDPPPVCIGYLSEDKAKAGLGLL
ncbi:Non-LTR retroelement reverse transcriptase [Senna tora]|uniref:Non-LTR retroelement reverse transcriptase n=1 Tax=Senna tora TaxID=362788 RepID=A0A834TW42_9FABA|nr:Non-LTR retroelement reverse transcriptase [Senna tora]